MRQRRLLACLRGAATLQERGVLSSSSQQQRRCVAAATTTSPSSSSPSREESSKQRRQPLHSPRSQQQQQQHRRRFDAVLLDATGTLITPSEPAAEVYRHYAALHGLDPPAESRILEGFRRAYSAPWPQQHEGSGNCRRSSSSSSFASSSSSSSTSSSSASSLARFASDGRPFWRAVVSHSLGLPHPHALPEECFEDIYGHYSKASAWTPARGAAAALEKLRRGGVRVAVCSNFDSRLPRILEGLGLAELVDAVAVSGEHAGAEKPGPVLFEAAIRALEELGPPPSSFSSLHPPPAPAPHRFGILPSSYSSPAFALDRARTLVVGDDRRNDVTGGRAAGCVAWLFGSDVRSLRALASRVLGEIEDDDEAEETDEDDEDAA